MEATLYSHFMSYKHLSGIAMFRTLLMLTTLAPFWVTSADAGNEVYVGSKTAGTKSLDEVDHSAWNSLLQKYVNDNGMVNYRAWHGSRADTQQLDRYLSLLSTGNPSRATRSGKLAFWINAYNAVTIRGILREYPTSSIRNHTARIFGYNIWKHLQLYVGGRPYSLEGIEHEILRKMNEPRIHFAIVCASVGCPRLLNEAYTAERVQQQLEDNAKDFFSRRRNFRYDASGQRFYLSEIFSWFGSDFGADQAGQLRRISDWLPTEATRQAAKRNAVSISYLDYNWNLNSQ